MKELNKLLTNDKYLNSWDELIKLILEIDSMYRELGDSIYGLDIKTEFELDSTTNYYYNLFPYIQNLVETNLDIELDRRIEFANYVTEVLIFLTQVNELPEVDYQKYRNNLYFTFGSFIGGYYLEKLEEYLKDIKTKE